MAKPVGSNKRELQKQQAEKRLNKQKRKEERQNNRATSFEDMIAYVDADGRITSTPPDLSVKREEIALEDIQISTPTKVEEAPVIHEGKVDYFETSKGFGFIKDATGNRYFFHISNAPQNIAEGCKVTFDTQKGPRGLNAINIVIVK